MVTNLTNAEDSIFKSAVYVSPTGKASSDGSYSSPLDLESAMKKVEEGKAKTVLLKAGTYSFNMAASGTYLILLLKELLIME